MAVRARKALAGASESLLALLLPDECRICGDPLRELSRIPVCTRCLRAPEPFAPEACCVVCRTPFLNSRPLDADGRCNLCRLGKTQFDAAYSYGLLDGPLRELIHLYKYRGVQPLARPLGRMLRLALPREARFDCLTAVPLHWFKYLRRGYNQSVLLARELSRTTSIPYERLLVRKRHTAAQASMTKAQRRDNIDGAFRVREPGSVQGKRILLIDDVLTTGATANECAAVLRRAGAKHVSFLTLARADGRSMQVSGLVAGKSNSIEAGEVQG